MSRLADPRARTTLLQAAEEVFAERGLAAAKVEEISKRANVSKGAFYLHFESKEAVLEQVVETFLARCKAHFAPPSEYPELPEEPDDLIDFYLERDAQMFEALWDNRAVLRILRSCHGEYDHLLDAFRSEIDNRSRQWIAHWRRVGLFRQDVDPELAATLMGGAYHELWMKMSSCTSVPPLEVWLRFALRTFIRAYGSSELIEAVERRRSVRSRVALPRPVP